MSKLRKEFEEFYKTIQPIVPQAGYEDVAMDAAYLSYIFAINKMNSYYKNLESILSNLVERDITYIDGKVAEGIYWTDVNNAREFLRNKK